MYSAASERNVPKTIDEFRNTRCEMTGDAFEHIYGAMCYYHVVYVYAGSFFISKMIDGKYHLQLERDEFVSDDIAELEVTLWERFAKNELGQ